MRGKKWIGCFCLCMAWGVAAQQQPGVTVRGVVTSVTDGQPVVGATVVQEGTGNETMTDRLGEFLLTAPSGSNILVSSTGYSRQTVTLKTGQTLYRIRLHTEEMAPEERLWEPTTVTLDEILQTKITGVQVFRNSWAPGAIGTVSVSGARGEPLYVVDGIPWNSNDIEALSPSDIVNIEVVKEAADIALYGKEGSEEIILITTRGGKAGATTITYDGGLSLQETGRIIPHMNLREYATYIKEHWQRVSAEFLDPSLLGEGTDWQKEVFRQGLMQTHQVSLQGGTERLKLVASSGWLEQEGTVIGSDFSRFHARARVDADVTRWLAVGASLSFAQTEKTSVNEALFATLLRTPPDIPVYNFDGSWGGKHPVWNALTQGKYYDKEYIAGILYAELTPFKGFSLRSEYGFQENRNYFNGEPDYGQSCWRWKNRLSYTHTKGRHRIAFLAGFEAMAFFYDDNGQAVYGNFRYEYDKRYHVALTLRADNRPLFSGNNADLMPGLSLAWSIADEPFLRGNPYLSTLKLRAGIFGRGENTGIDIAFLEDRFALTFDTYTRFYDSDLEYNPDFPDHVSGDHLHRGFDLSVRSVNIDLPNFRWVSALNASSYSGMVFGFHNTATFRGWEAILSLTGTNSSRNYIISDYFEEEGSMHVAVYSSEPDAFIRIHNIAIGYSFPVSLIKSLSIGALKIQASVQNPYVFTTGGGFDPETNVFGYPPYRGATLALHVRF
ncbi:MAG: carboxypeptidase-like regulatory domain-containing protein [Tannerellaceae bacterium]|nr:carboxypeptidase-like regulatory domain-containing protein [Tannerellaceae bacterium]